MRIAVFEIEEWEREALAAALAGHEAEFFSGALTAESAADAREAEAVSVFIYSKIDRALLDSLPNLKFITTRSMGYDHIDLAACKERGVTVARVPAYGERTVAEHAFGLILAISRKIFLAYERTEKRIFDYRGLQGIDLFGKTIGIVGGGKIGMNVARIAKGFGMEIVVSDPFPNAALSGEIGFSYVSLDELLSRSDVISLHAPYMKETHHLIGESALAKVKRGAILVNTARGALIDTKALLKGLETGVFSGAGLDVLEDECLIKEETELMAKGFPEKCDLQTLVRNHMLIARNDVVITPHIAFNSREAVERILKTTAENLNAFAAGAPVNLVS